MKKPLSPRERPPMGAYTVTVRHTVDLIGRTRVRASSPEEAVALATAKGLETIAAQALGREPVGYPAYVAVVQDRAGAIVWEWCGDGD